MIRKKNQIFSFFRFLQSFVLLIDYYAIAQIRKLLLCDLVSLVSQPTTLPTNQRLEYRRSLPKHKEYKKLGEGTHGPDLTLFGLFVTFALFKTLWYMHKTLNRSTDMQGNALLSLSVFH